MPRFTEAAVLLPLVALHILLLAFGCRPGERVPYLHYYYTDQWLLERSMGDISHIASNHSTWDLELESLSVESLLLIYADFRSKSERDKEGNEIR